MYYNFTKSQVNQEKVLEVINHKLKHKFKVKITNEYLVKKTGLTKSQVEYAIEKLKQKKLVDIQYKSKKKGDNRRFFKKVKTGEKSSGEPRTVTANTDKEKPHLKNTLYTIPLFYNQSKNFIFDVYAYIDNLEFEYQKNWFNFKLSINHTFDNLGNANYELNRMKELSNKYGISEELLVEIAIENNLYGLSMVNESHIIAHQNRQAKVTKVDFQREEPKKQPEDISKAEKLLLAERSKKVITSYLQQLKNENQLKWYKYSSAIEKLGNWLVEKKNFHFDCVNHFSKTAEKLIKVAQDHNQDIEKIVDYNIKYNKHCYFIYAIGDARKTKKTVIPMEDKFTPKPETTPPQKKQINVVKPNEPKVATQFRQKIIDRFGSNTYLCFFDDCQITVENTTVTLACENNFTLDLIEKEYLYSRKNGDTIIFMGLEDLIKKIDSSLTLRLKLPKDKAEANSGY